VKLDNTSDITSAIAGTDDDALYRSYLSSTGDLNEIRYEVPITPGTYYVRLHFVENFFTTSGSRVVSTRIENQLMLANLDIFEEVGFKSALVKDFTVTTDATLNINFNPSVNRLALAGVEIFSPIANNSARVAASEEGKKENKFNMSLHPNPTAGKFTIALNGIKAADVLRTTLTDIVGIVQWHNSHKVLNDESLEIDISSLKAGTYLIMVQTADSYQILRVVKQ
jgi:hypothetical protein